MEVFGVVIERVPRDLEIAKTRKPQYYTGQNDYWSTQRDQACLFKPENVAATLVVLNERATNWCREDADDAGYPIATNFRAIELFMGVSNGR